MLKKMLLGFMSALLMTSSLSMRPIEAEENNHSIASDTSITYTSDIQDHQRRHLFNDHWKFHYGEQSNAEKPSFDDSAWRDVQLPHDYSLELPYTKQGEAESGYKLGGIGWYRKTFTLSPSARDKRVFVEFGGVYMNATVYINGHQLGEHPNGYTPFAYDLSPYLNDGENVLAVRVNHKFPSSRWYSGSGIYRDVHLTVTDDVHVDHYGVKIKSPDLEQTHQDKVDVIIQTSLTNESDESQNVVLKQSIRKKGTEAILSSVESDSFSLASQQSLDKEMILSVTKPDLWSVETPHLYEVITEVILDNQVVDQVINDYGFRYFNFDAQTGFSLNDEKMKLKGVSMHSDQGSLGAAAHTRAIERQVEILKDMGVNAIRVTHNPAADQLIEIANRKGMLLIDEAFDTWVSSKNGNYHDYAVWFNKKVGDNPLLGAKADMTWAEFDIKTMVRRGINAPSIISWSVGNEVMEGNSGPYKQYPEILEKLVTWVGEVDDTRPSTIGDNKFKAGWGESQKFGEILTKHNGLVGMNYSHGSHFDQFHKNNPDWALYGAETASSINSRGVYKPSNYDRHLTSYDESTVGWGKLSADSWHSIITRDFMAGEFVWTGFDYLGEPTPHNNVGPGATGAWPSPKSSYFGIVDTAGFPKDRYYFYQSQWNDKVDTLHILPAWKEDMVEIKDGKVRVDVYSNAAGVELIFENKQGEIQSLGRKDFTQHTTEAGYTYQMYEGKDKKSQAFRNMYLTWDVPYEDGTIKAIAYDENNQVIENTQGRDKVTTFGEASDFKMQVDRPEIIANGRDLAYITIDVLDEKGNIVEDANNLIKVKVEGEGELIALDNGDQLDHEPYDSGQRKAFNGKLLAIVKSSKQSGSFTIHVESEGLKSQSLKVKTLEDPEISKDKHVVAYEIPKSYYVKQGHKPNLTDTATIYFNDQTQEDFKVNWNLDEIDFNESAIHKVYGKIDELNLTLSTSVTVIENVGALLNYSTVVPVGTESVNLPASRPIVLENGEVLDVEFPVTWDKQDRSQYQKPGIVEITGKANIFGEDHKVSASVRVAKADVKKGANIASNYLTLTQNIPKQYQSDNLLSIVDGNTGFKTVTSGPNDSIWTNYDMAQTGQNESEIVFTFATAQFIGEVDLHFYQDAWAARLPKDVEMYWSNEGTENAEWSKIEFVESKGETSSGVPNTTKVNYRFDGVPAVGFKIVLRSEEGSNQQGKKLAVGLTEAELYVVHTDLSIYDRPDLDVLKINGYPVDQTVLKRKDIYTEYEKADVFAQGHENAAVTILPVKDDVIHILTESENHQNRSHYRIYLNQVGVGGDLAAEDDSRDYPYQKTIATAGAYHPNHPSEGHPQFAVDNDGSTIFHTPWSGTDPSNFWITLELEEETKIESLRYLSRGGSPNGIVEEYKVECSMDNEHWEEVSTGKWEMKSNHWSLAPFSEAKTCKFVRLTALSTYGEGAQKNKFMSAKEIRLRMPEMKRDIQEATIQMSQDKYAYTGKAIEPDVDVLYENKQLHQGVDYRVEYFDNVNVGTAKILVTGIENFGGKQELEFEIYPVDSIDTEALKLKLEEVKALDLSNFTDESVEKLAEAIADAEHILENADKQTQIDQAISQLDDAISLLVEKVDTQKLKDLLEFIASIDSNQYTEESYQALLDSSQEASSMLEEDLRQEDVEEMIDHLEKLIEALEPVEGALNKEILRLKIMTLKKLDEKLYTKESFETLQKVIEEAEETLVTAQKQQEIDQVLSELMKAFEELEFIQTDEPKEPVKPEDPKEPVKPEEPKEPVKPEEPKEPVKPEEPKEPVKPEEPKEPVKPEEPKEPVKPEEPKEPQKPLNPENDDRIEKLPATGVPVVYGLFVVLILLGSYLYIRQYRRYLKD